MLILKFTKIPSIIALFLLHSLFTLSQKPPIKFGKVDKASLEMNIYARDTSAEAVILCDYGRFDPNDFNFYRNIRIKILKKGGYDWANMTFPSHYESHIKGITFNLENNEIKADKLKNESIFSERVTENYYRTRITMPNVKVGSILDIQITYPGLPIEWKFQDMIPVVWSELILPLSEYVQFQKKFTGYEPLYITTSNRWVGKEMPAFKSEPYINSPSNYITKFEIEISNISLPGYYFKDYTSSWDAVNKYFISSRNFGMLLDDMGLFLNNDVKDINYLMLTDEEKIYKAVELIKENIKWNEKNEIYVLKDLGRIFKTEKIGNSAEINFTLMLLLKKLGFRVSPAILSTRENGFINPYMPTIDKFNYVIAFVEHKDKEYFLDATDKNVPADLLPERCLNGQVLIINESQSKWINLPTDKVNNRNINGEFDLLPTGELKGKIVFTRNEYAASRFRKKYQEYNSLEEYSKNFEQENPVIYVNECNINDIDNINKSVSDEYEITILNKTSVINDEIYIDPLLFLKLAGNPFKPEKRIYPVDFTIPHADIIFIKFNLPEGFSIKGLPEPCKFIMPDKTAEFVYNPTSFGNSIQITAIFKINKPVYLQTEYPLLREFYNMVIDKQSEPVIIKHD
jgi:hypothetical protein